MATLFFDLETTGIDENINSIIEIGAILHIDGKAVQAFEGKGFNSDSTINLGALKVNNTTLEDLNKYGDEKGMVYSFSDWLVKISKLTKEPIEICGHNVNFDLKFINKAFARYNITGWERLVSHRVEDTCVISRFLVKAGVIDKLELGPKGAGLSNIAKFLDVDLSKYTLHSALDDAKLTAEVYYKFLELIKR